MRYSHFMRPFSMRLVRAYLLDLFQAYVKAWFQTYFQTVPRLCHHRLGIH